MKNYFRLAVFTVLVCLVFPVTAQNNSNVSTSNKSLDTHYPFKGFCLSVTTQAQLVLPAEVTSYWENDIIESKFGFGGESGIELSYHFKYFGISVGINFGTFSVVNLRPHLEQFPYIDLEDPHWSFANQMPFRDRSHNMMFPVKFELHAPLNDRFWLVGDIGVKFAPGYEMEKYINDLWLSADEEVACKKLYTSAVADLGFAYELPYGDLLRCTVGANISFKKTMTGYYVLPNYDFPDADAGSVSTFNHSLNLQLAYIHTFHRYKTKAKQDQSWREELSSHEFQFNVGDPVLTMSSASSLAAHNGFTGFFHASYSLTPSANYWTLPLGDYAITRYVPVFSFNYHYRIAKWFWIGGLTTFSGVHNTWRDRLTDESTGHGKELFWSLMPDIRFSYLNRKHVTLYSGIGAGMFLSHYKDHVYGNDTPHNQVSLGFQLTAFGVKAGSNHWFGDLELGMGYKGFVSAGFGYDF
ncbi:MAG: hypothetical protein J5799_04930 [Bacteroidales bacterium]|nr:hypothetical protein [Bacteroidales bacterium]